MIPIYTQFTSDFRVHLGDTEVAAGQVWTDASGKCDPYLQQAYSELYKGYEGGGLKNITRTLYGNLPAYTSYINPATLGAANLSEPSIKPLWERDSAGSVAITNAVPNTATPGAPFVRLTSGAPHGLTNGQMALTFGILGLSDDVNDQWSVVVQDSVTFDLMGCTATGTYVSGGTATSSTQDWCELRSVPEIRDFPQTPGGSLGVYAWINGAFRVPPSTAIRQVKMEFYLSAKAPTFATPTASLGFDDCLGFLAYRGAALATLDRAGATQKFKQLNQIALGPTEQHADLGGLYGMLIRSKDRGAARNPVVVAGYRNPRRNSGWVNRY